MTPQQLRLIADIIEFDMPYRVTLQRRLPASDKIPENMQIGEEATIELLPGDGYEFVKISGTVLANDEVYLPKEGWVSVLSARNIERNPSGPFRRKRPVHPPFGDPPEGYTWHNPDNLTPEQVGTGDGWRLCCKEETANLPDEGWLLGKKAWVSPIGATSDKYQKTEATYRTKAPLPMTERQKFDAWMDNAGYKQFNVHMFDAWKAAKQSK